MSKKEKLVKELEKAREQMRLLAQKEATLKEQIKTEEQRELEQLMRKRGMTMSDVLNLVSLSDCDKSESNAPKAPTFEG